MLDEISKSVMKKEHIYTLLLCVLFCTQLRTIVTFLMPVFVMVAMCMFKVRMNSVVIVMFLLIAASSTFGIVLGNIDVANAVLFCWMAMPLFFLQFGKQEYKFHTIRWSDFWHSLTQVVFVVDLIGLICLIILHTQDDFGQGYGTHFKGVSGLAMTNAMISLFYLSRCLLKQQVQSNSIKFLIFFVSSVLCFSGLTLLTYLVTLAIYFMLSRHIKILFFTIPFLLIAFLLLYKTDWNIWEYNAHNIEMFTESKENGEQARKRIMYDRVLQLTQEEPLMICTVGCGPAGYNGRACFLINIDSENLFTQLLGHHMPFYHKRDIYPLWNNNFVAQERYNDGARNKPFSSLVAIWAELGAVFFFLFIVLWLLKMKKYYKLAKDDADILFLMLLNIFLILALLTEYWLESSEYLLFLLIQGSLLNRRPDLLKKIN